MHAMLVQVLAGNAVDRQDAHRRRPRLPHPRLRPGRPGGAADHPGQRGGAGARPRRWCAARSWAVSPSSAGATPARRSPRSLADLGQAARPRTGGAQLLGRVGVRRLGAARPGRSARRFDYAKQRCTAYPRFVVQRSLFHQLPRRLPAGDRLGAVRSSAGRRGPRRSAARARLRPADQRRQGQGARPTRSTRRSPRAGCRCTGASLDDGRFLPGQDTSAYLAPVADPRPAAARRRCSTPSRSARSTRSCWSTPRPSCWPR